MVAEPEVYTLAFEAAELSPEVLTWAVELFPVTVSVVAEPEVFTLAFVASELSPEVLTLAVELSPETVSAAAEPEVFALAFGAAELSPEVLTLAVELFPVTVSVVAEFDVFGSQASVDIAAAFVALVLVFVVVVGVDNSGRPKFLAFPNVDYYASFSSFVEVVGRESAHSSTGGRTNHGLCSILSNLGLYQNKNLEHRHNKTRPRYKNVSDTNDFP